jgi:hypothetical protein
MINKVERQRCALRRFLTTIALKGDPIVAYNFFCEVALLFDRLEFWVVMSATPNRYAGQATPELWRRHCG